MFLSASPVPQTGIPGIHHSIFESLLLGRSSQSIASGLLPFGIPITSRKTVCLWESRFSSLMKRFIPAGRANHYMPSWKADVVGQIHYVQGSDSFQIIFFPF
ncbi:hypothetical protein IGI04_014647 [Brassica rapa subsp. trilocularis]|uniref:Uncharacterized protein n=1 Tax=Brassica rapa subsp. trilocularis TaxID=1813537 RepID=A0ABQ7MNG7_BRACM|nr:hypothetical protein IGI04_014647 [Brassica rapa subsp. trilocularis]